MVGAVRGVVYPLPESESRDVPSDRGVFWAASSRSRSARRSRASLRSRISTSTFCRWMSDMFS